MCKEKKINEQDPKASELSEKDLDQVAGGGANQPINGVGVGLGKKKPAA